MTDEITERIRLIMQEYNNSPSAFADEIGVQRPAISHIMSGRNRPSLDVVMKILKAYDQINPQWLLTGEGKMKQLDLFGEINKSEDIKKSEESNNQILDTEKPRESSVGKQPVYSPATAQSQPLDSGSEISKDHTPLSNPVSHSPVVEQKAPEQATIPNLQQAPVENRYYQPGNQQTEQTYRPERTYNQVPPVAQAQPVSQPQAESHNHPYNHPVSPPPIPQHSAGIPAELFGGGSGGKKVEKIVILYADKSFSVYHPE